VGVEGELAAPAPDVLAQPLHPLAVVQLLGELRPEDRAAGVRVRAGDRLRVEDVDGERNRCTVSYLGR
jgi:hypothetical protein